MATQHPTDQTSTTTESNDGTVDTAPITNSLERRNSLEKALQHRPDEQDLKDRHILLDTTAAPALQAKAAELERQRVMDNLRKGLAHRPEKEELVERNILAGGPAAPALQEKQRELEKHMRADSLEKQLSNRPKPEDLIKEGILNADENPVSES
ncbi:hypothetical protein KC333_g5236 [Hortaea werneckii]|nr:hypothetical protein KC333_g5236 [Hortaea werneckii]KAI7321866.1 hypothetical protein KC326_g2032 [Hortaea werneckii]